MATTDVEIVKYVADVSGLEQGQRQLEQSLLKSKVSADVLKRSLKESEQSARLYKDRLAELDAELKKNGNLSADSAKEQQRLKAALAQSTATIDVQRKALHGLEKQTTLANQRLKETVPALKGVEDQSKKSNTAFSGLAKTFIAFFAFSQIKAFIKDIFDVTAQFQKFEAVLTNTLGSNSLARKALQDIQQFAKETPFGVQEVTGAFVKLANQGFTPTIVELRKLGDLVASTGKTFDQLAEALLDAQQGQYRRLLEFGIRATKQGEQVAFTFKGVKTVVDDNAEAIRNYIVGLGDLEGVLGASAAVAETLGGKVEKLGDSFDQFLLKLGEGRLKKVFGGFIDLLANTLDIATDLVKTYEQRQQDSTDKFVNDRIKIQNQVDQDEITKLIDSGKTKLEAEKEYYSKRLEVTQQAAKILEDNIGSQQARIKILEEQRANLGAVTSSRKEYNERRKALNDDIQLEYTYLRNLEVNLALRSTQRDQYNKNLIDNEKAVNAELNKVDKDAEKKRKKALDDETKAFALQEQQRRAYNDFNISLIADQFDREAAQKKEQFFRTIEDSKKNIGTEITTNSEQYKLLSDALLKDLADIEQKRKEFEDKAREERNKKIIEGVNAEIKALESKGKTLQAADLKILRDNFQAQIKAGDDFVNTKEVFEKKVTQATYEGNKRRLQAEISTLNQRIIENQGNDAVLIQLHEQLTAKSIELDNEEYENWLKNQEEMVKQEKIHQDKILLIKQAAAQAASNILNFVVDQQQQRANEQIEAERQNEATKTQVQIDNIDKRVKAGYLSEKQAASLKDQVAKQAAKKEQELKLRQFKADQDAAIARAAINTALGATNALVTGDPYTAALRVAIVVALGALEIGLIKAQKPPKYKDGSEIGIKGKGTRTSDSIDAKLSVGETVLSAKETDELRPFLETYRSKGLTGLFNDTNPSSFMPAFNAEKERKAQYKRRKEASKERKEKQSMIDLSTLEKQTARNGSVKIKNPDEIGKSVANHIKFPVRYGL